MPIGMTGQLVRAEQHPLLGFSCGGAHGSSGGTVEPIDDFRPQTTSWAPALVCAIPGNALAVANAQ